MTEATEPAVRSLKDKEIAQEFVERARDERADLVGPGGVLTGLAKNMLEAGLKAEMSEHLGYDKHGPQGRERGSNSRNGTWSRWLMKKWGLSGAVGSM